VIPLALSNQDGRLTADFGLAIFKFLWYKKYEKSRVAL